MTAGRKWCTAENTQPMVTSPRRELRGVAQTQHRPVQMLDCRGDLAQEAGSQQREFHAARRPIEQPDAQARLEVRDPAREGRHGQMQRLGRGREAAQFGRGDERTQVPEAGCVGRRGFPGVVSRLLHEMQ